jgi:multisubunit Na+/H+ antiporter MnhG subunit
MSGEGDGGLDVGRLARTLTLIAFVTAVFLFFTADRLGGDLFQIGAVVIASIALVTAISSFIIAAVSYQEDLDEAERARA